jgi:hypothetical protein
MDLRRRGLDEALQRDVLGGMRRRSEQELRRGALRG